MISSWNFSYFFLSDPPKFYHNYLQIINFKGYESGRKYGVKCHDQQHPEWLEAFLKPTERCGIGSDSASAKTITTPKAFIIFKQI
jgi:hypothetical protein